MARRGLPPQTHRAELPQRLPQINIRCDWFDGQLGRPKSRASRAAVEMHETVAALLQSWRQETPYSKDSDFVFPFLKLRGKQPRLAA